MRNPKNLFFALSFVLVAGLAFSSCNKDEMTSLELNYQTPEDSTFFADCFSIVYPIELNFPDGTSTSIDSDEALESAIGTWYETQGEDAEDPVPTFPVEVLLEDGSTQTINNELELEELWDQCYPDDGYDDHYGDDCFDEIDFLDCFEITYPIQLVGMDSTLISINSDEELEQALDDAYMEDRDLEVVFPVEVTFLEDGETYTLTTEEEAEELFDACYEEEFDELDALLDLDFTECFTVEFPIVLLSEDSTATTINNLEELEDLIDLAFEEEELYFPTFPITVTLKEDDSVVTLTDEEELFDLIDTCADQYDDEEDDGEDEDG